MKDHWLWFAPIPPALITTGFILRAFGRSTKQGWFAVVAYAILWIYGIKRFLEIK